MTKIVKINDKASGVKKDLISKFGEMIYHTEGVQSVVIKVNFQDGSNIGFRRCEADDSIDEMLEEEE